MNSNGDNNYGDSMSNNSAFSSRISSSIPMPPTSRLGSGYEAGVSAMSAGGDYRVPSSSRGAFYGESSGGGCSSPFSTSQQASSVQLSRDLMGSGRASATTARGVDQYCRYQPQSGNSMGGGNETSLSLRGSPRINSFSYNGNNSSQGGHQLHQPRAPTRNYEMGSLARLGGINSHNPMSTPVPRSRATLLKIGEDREKAKEQLQAQMSMAMTGSRILPGMQDRFGGSSSLWRNSKSELDSSINAARQYPLPPRASSYSSIAGNPINDTGDSNSDQGSRVSSTIDRARHLISGLQSNLSAVENVAQAQLDTITRPTGTWDNVQPTNRGFQQERDRNADKKNKQEYYRVALDRQVEQKRIRKVEEDRIRDAPPEASNASLWQSSTTNPTGMTLQKRGLQTSMNNHNEINVRRAQALQNLRRSRSRISSDPYNQSSNNNGINTQRASSNYNNNQTRHPGGVQLRNQNPSLRENPYDHQASGSSNNNAFPPRNNPLPGQGSNSTAEYNANYSNNPRANVPIHQAQIQRNQNQPQNQRQANYGASIPPRYQNIPQQAPPSYQQQFPQPGPSPGYPPPQQQPFLPYPGQYPYQQQDLRPYENSLNPGPDFQANYANGSFQPQRGYAHPQMPQMPQQRSYQDAPPGNWQPQYPAPPPAPVGYPGQVQPNPPRQQMSMDDRDAKNMFDIMSQSLIVDTPVESPRNRRQHNVNATKVKPTEEILKSYERTKEYIEDRLCERDVDFDELREDVFGKPNSWQTSETLPNMNLKELINRAELRHQIELNKRRRAEKLAKDKEEDEKLEMKIQAYNREQQRRHASDFATNTKATTSKLSSTINPPRKVHKIPSDFALTHTNKRPPKSRQRPVVEAHHQDEDNYNTQNSYQNQQEYRRIENPEKTLARKLRGHERGHERGYRAGEGDEYLDPDDFKYRDIRESESQQSIEKYARFPPPSPPIPAVQRKLALEEFYHLHEELSHNLRKPEKYPPRSRSRSRSNREEAEVNLLSKPSGSEEFLRNLESSISKERIIAEKKLNERIQKTTTIKPKTQ